MNARECALKALYEIEYNGAYSNLALKNILKKDVEPRDKTLITSLVYGVTDKKITLDYIISKNSKLKLKKISKYIFLILRIGVYQLKYMDKIPQSAAVNESVKLAKRYGHRASAGFVNGVLHSCAEYEIEYPADRAEYLSLKYSVPIEICRRWIASFGGEFTDKMLCAFEEPPKLTLRPNTLKTTVQELSELLREKGISCTATDDYVVCDGFDIARDSLYINGCFTVQDAAAMQAAKLLAPKSGETVIDMCAAPGGKTTHLAELMGNMGCIYAFDIHKHKTELIQKNAERLGITIIKPSVGDGRICNEEFLGIADKVLCDVPCSGFGILRRKPEIKYNHDDISKLPKLQREILENAAKYLKRGGDMIYSTCTIEKAENEGVTSSFLAAHSEFAKEYEKTFYPHIDGTDGFYICKMKRVK